MDYQHPRICWWAMLQCSDQMSKKGTTELFGFSVISAEINNNCIRRQSSHFSFKQWRSCSQFPWYFNYFNIYRVGSERISLNELSVHSIKNWFSWALSWKNFIDLMYFFQLFHCLFIEFSVSPTIVTIK